MCVSKGESELIERVTGALNPMELYQLGSEGRVQSNTLSYSIEIDAWSVASGIKSKEYFRMKYQTYQPTDFSDGYYKVVNEESIVQYMNKLQNSGVHSEALDTVTYNTVIGAYARFAKNVNKDAHIKAEKVLTNMIHLCNNGNLSLHLNIGLIIILVITWLMTKQPNSSEKSY